jgi:hypothetical protein
MVFSRMLSNIHWMKPPASRACYHSTDDDGQGEQGPLSLPMMLRGGELEVTAETLDRHLKRAR